MVSYLFSIQICHVDEELATAPDAFEHARWLQISTLASSSNCWILAKQISHRLHQSQRQFV